MRTFHSGGSTTTIHTVHDLEGKRLAEYEAGSGTLLREYVWLGDKPLAVIEDGQTYYVRWDNIGRPVMATDSLGAVVWEATYLPFGDVWVETSTGAMDSPELRFPGQWYQAESGLHHNWMRDYDPTTGRYLQADPLGLVDGASVYGYARQSPMRYADPTGQCPWCVGFVFWGLVSVEVGMFIEFTIGDGCYSLRDFAFDFVFGGATGSLTKALFIGGRAATAIGSRAGTKVASNSATKGVNYSRPSGYRAGVRDKAWDNAKEAPTGQVRDPATGRFMSKDKPWDMGHKPGHEFRKHQQSAQERGTSRKQFIDEHNNPNNYRPELPSSNRSHRGEDMTNRYYGP